MYLTRRKRLHLSRILFFVSGILLCCIYSLTVRARLPEPWLEAQIGDDPMDGHEEAVEAVVQTPEETAAGEDALSTGTPPVNINQPTVVEHPVGTSVASPPTAASTTTPMTTANSLTTTNSATTMTATTTTTTTQTTNATIKTTTSSAELPPTTTTNRTVVHCIFVDPNPSQPSPAPTPAVTPITPVPDTTLTTPAAGEEVPHAKAEYPHDIFTVQDRRNGWVTLHIFGMVYMFVALAIVCDEFFVPTLGVITDRLQISDDVAGATFMAAGGSAPELFTSLIGVFISHSNVGIGTIVGSAVFNILFVIGMCAVFSREMLHLTWWPLFRDVSFYILDLIMLIVFFLDNTIMPWESCMLIGGYTSYVVFMKFNVQIESAVKGQLMKHKNIVIAVEEPEKDTGTAAEDSRPPDPEDKNRLKLKPALQRGGSSASLHNSTMRSTIFQLMIHTLDPLGEVKFKDKAQILNKMAKAKLQAKAQQKSDGAVGDADPSKEPKEEKKEEKKEEDIEEGKEGEEQEAEEEAEEDKEEEAEEEAEDEKKEEDKEEAKEGTPEAHAEEEEETPEKPEEQEEGQETAVVAHAGGEDDSEEDSDDDSDDDDDDDDDESDDDDKEEAEVQEEGEEEEEEEKEEPLSLEWPETRRKQVTYLLLLPIVFPLWLTVPDVRNPASRRFFAITFIGSITWIAVFSYLMVWWAHQVGETIGISEEIMGLTILAAGTSIPDLITSVIVARKGLGDMAVSSSVGSNIFDITVGLPVPWLMWSCMHNFAPVMVSSNGLFCAIVLLFLMLLFVIISIASCKWKMNKALGFTMFVLYFVFLVLSVMLEDRIIVCPVSI